MKEDKDKVMELARRKGFLWSSFEIYDGIAGFYDYGPLGAMLKRGVEEEWRKFYVIGEGFYEIETTDIAPIEIFEASGHLKSFKDEALECRSCKSLFRADLVSGKCSECGGDLERVGDFNLMFQTKIGMKGENYGCLRPETAQGIFINFQRLLRFNRNKLPFGIVQIGKAYRNEISPRQGVIRLREFTLAEAEVFVDPEEKNRHPRFQEVKNEVLRLMPSNVKGKRKEEGERSIDIEVGVEEAVRNRIIGNEYMGYHIAKVQMFLKKIGISSDKIRFRQHKKEEMAHYAYDCWDAEFLSNRFGWMEIVGIADRGSYDLSAHATLSKVDMSYILSNGEKRIPHVIEPSYGIDRLIYALLECSFYEERVGTENRKVLCLKQEIAPIKAAVLPLLGRKKLEEKAKEVFVKLRGVSLRTEGSEASIFVEYDDSGSIGRRYRRQDEIGTPYCITIDYETLEDDTVTIRERDTMKQVRVPIGGLQKIFAEGISKDIFIEEG